MIAATPYEVTDSLLKAGLSRPLAPKVRRALREAQAAGVMRGLMATLRPGDICIDCGAHKGEITNPLAATGATVHAFEPDPDNFAVLEAATKAPNVTLHQTAVGTQAGQVTLFRSKVSRHDAIKGATGSSVVAANAVANPENTVAAEVIDFVAFLKDVIRDHGRIAFLKIDIEGAELDLLEALVDSDILPHINLTAVETHRWLLPKEAHRFDRLHKVAAARPELNLFLMWI